MKKGLIFATTLAMALGVGVAVGAHQKEAAEVKAANVPTVYCKVAQSWWKTDGAAVGAYFWKGKDAEKVEPYAWPGQRMSAVSGQTDLWSIDVPANVEKVIFTRVNGSGTIADWGAKTSDLDIQSVKNCYTVTSSSAVWGDPGVAGEWSVYPTVAPEYHLLGTFNGWNDPNDDYVMTVDAGDANHYTLAGVDLTAGGGVKVCDVKNDDWYGDHGNNVVVAEDGEYDVDFYVHADNEVNVVLTKKQAVTVSYSLSYNNGTIAFAPDDEHKPEGSLHQYKATITTAWRARVLQFFKKVGDAEPVLISNIGVDWDGEAPVPENNIVGDTSTGFRIYTSGSNMDVYLKEYTNGYSLWGTGYAENSYWLSHVSKQLTLDSTFVPDETYTKQYMTSSEVALAKLEVAEANQNYYITDDAGHGMQSLNMETAGNNNAVAVTGSYFNVHNSCNEVVYLKEKADLSLWLYIGGYEEAHVLTIGGKEVTLHKGEGTQYEAHGVSLTAGDTVTSYAVEGVAQTVTAKVVGNNNLDENKKVLANNASADIYYDPEAKTLWVSGIPEGGYHLYKNGNTVVQMTATEDYGDYKQYKTESVSFAAGDTVEILDATGAEGVQGPVVWTITSFEESEEALNFEVVDGKIKCKTACTTRVYLKLKYQDDRIYFGAEEQYIKDAKGFVNNFKTAMAAACSAENKQEAVEEAWAQQATAFAALVKEARDEVKLGGYSSVEEIREFAKRYIGIYEQHAANWDLDEFLDWELTPNPAYNNVNLNTADNNTIIIVISIAAVSALAFTTLLVFKKRKQK